MTNHMKEVAALLGVEIGEELEIKGSPCTYYIDEEGLRKVGTKEIYTIRFNELLTGKTEIVHKPFVPKMGEFYYSFNGNVNFDTDIRVQRYVFNGCLADYDCIAMGNCFKSAKADLFRKDEVIERYKAIKDGVERG